GVREHPAGLERPDLALSRGDALLDRRSAEHRYDRGSSTMTSLMMSTARATIPPSTTNAAPAPNTTQSGPRVRPTPPTMNPTRMMLTATQDLGRPAWLPVDMRSVFLTVSGQGLRR